MDIIYWLLTNLLLFEYSNAYFELLLNQNDILKLKPINLQNVVQHCVGHSWVVGKLQINIYYSMWVDTINNIYSWRSPTQTVTLGPEKHRDDEKGTTRDI